MNEIVDVYDRNKNKLGYTKVRGVDSFKNGEYIIGVQLVILNDKNEILITKRSDFKKVLPGKWECNGGAIAKGETPIEGLVREFKEELGIIINKHKLTFLKTVIDDEKHNIKEIYLYKDYIDINNLIFSDKEVSDAKYVSINEYMKMFNDGDVVYNNDFDLKDYNNSLNILERN